jgi:hypothetical protein
MWGHRPHPPQRKKLDPYCRDPHDHPTRASQMSASGAKQTFNNAGVQEPQSPMTQFGHRQATFAAMHERDLLYLNL